MEEANNVRAEELREGRMGILALQQMQMTERHDMCIAILRGHKENIIPTSYFIPLSVPSELEDWLLFIPF